MRLINTRTGEFVSVSDPRTVHYATLSHVWSKPGSPNYIPEQTYQQVCEILDNRCGRFSPSLPGGYYTPCSTPSESVDEDAILPYLSDKIRRFCEVASADGFELAWADMCCIDHTNPSELEEAIASMYDWYSYAKACYVYLPDVSSRDPHARPGQRWEKEFHKSQWFHRGWTLQELLAPNVVVFLSRDWHVLGSKHELAPQIKEITSIPRAVIRCQKSLDTVSVAQRMSWAAERKTTREEDRAYSLLGIFGVNIRIVYGEGSYAFYRLQQAIIDEIPDQTIFAWGLPLDLGLCTRSLLAGGFSRPCDEHLAAPSTTSPRDSQQPSKPPVTDLYRPQQYLLANSPDDFKGSSDLVPLGREAFAEKLGIRSADAFQTFRPTPHGMSAHFPLVKVTQPSDRSAAEPPVYLALLACKFGHADGLVALILRPYRNVPLVNAPMGTEYAVGTRLASGPHNYVYVRAAVLSPEQCRMFVQTFARLQVFIAHRPSRALHKQGHDAPLYKDLATTREGYQVQFCGWSSRLLEQQGYRAEIIHSPMGAVANEGPLRFAIAQDGVEHGLRLEGQVGCSPTGDSEAMAVTVQCSNDMELRDCDSDSGPVHRHDSLVTSWKQQRGAAMKELSLVSFHGESLTLRLVITHEPRDPSRSAEGRTSIYRFGVEIFKNQSQAPSRSHAFPSPVPSGGIHTARHLPVLPTRRRNRAESAATRQARSPPHNRLARLAVGTPHHN